MSKNRKIYLFENPQEVDEARFQAELLPLLPLWRREEALKFRFTLGRVLCAKAFLLLQQGLLQDFGIKEAIAFDYVRNGKPVLRNTPDVYFNLSHCKNAVLCVIDTVPVGCDVETPLRRVDDALLRRCCNDAELREVKLSENPNRAFIRLWTAKEAVCKLSGEGLTDDLPMLLENAHREGVEVETVENVEKNYVYSIAQRR